MAIDYSNIESVVDGFAAITNLTSIAPPPPPIPTPLILTGVPLRMGLSATKIASNIIKKRAELGLPVGVLPSGAQNPDILMETARVEAIIDAIQQDGIISIAIPPGIPLSAAGISPAGPVTVFGATISPFRGYGVMQ